jgi:hypothetical protein
MRLREPETDTHRMTASTTKIERSAPAIRAVLAEVSPQECTRFEAESGELSAPHVTVTS